VLECRVSFLPEKGAASGTAEQASCFVFNYFLLLAQGEGLISDGDGKFDF
jgi:hypothetical protein